MNHVVAIIHPFVVQQEVDVYMNGECVKTVSCKLNELDKVCYNLCKEYNINQLDLNGQDQYALHLRDKLTSSTEYEDFKINVDIL